MNDVTLLKMVVGANIPRPRGLSGAMAAPRARLAVNEHGDVEDQQRGRVLLPICPPVSRRFSNQRRKAGRVVAAVHDPRHYRLSGIASRVVKTSRDIGRNHMALSPFE